MTKRVLMTGAAGRVGTILRPGLARHGWSSRGFDLVAPQGAEQDDSEWIIGDVTDPDALAEAMRGVDAVIHLAGIPDEDHFAKLLKANIDGTYQVFEAAHRAGVGRVLYASSNHAVGYHERADYLEADIPVDVRARPDTYYGVTKAFGEALGSFYADRHGLSVACVRIGSCFPRPGSERMLSTWLSPDDAVRLFHALLVAPDLGFETVYGISANTRGWWDLEPARRLGYEPKDDSESFAAELLSSQPPLYPADPDARYLGGRFTTHVPPA
jgi:uronate dehydrogenase